MKKRLLDFGAKGRGVAGRAWGRVSEWTSGAWAWPRGWVAEHLLGLSLGVSVAGLGAGVVVTAVDPGWVSGGESGSTTIRNLGIVLAGLIALPLAVWRGRVADRQATATDKQAETAQKDLLNKRYQDSAGMLGHDVLAVRLAGIYALERLAKEHPQGYHIEVMKSLCAFVRNPIRYESLGPVVSTESGWELTSSGGEDYDLRPDVQAAMDAICACHGREFLIETEARFRLDLRAADFRGLKIWLANLDNARLVSAELSKVFMIGWDLSDADLTGANLSGAIVCGAHLSRARMLLANVSGADFTGNAFSSSSPKPDPDPATALGSAAAGLTQAQLDSAIADPENPPKLEGVLDAETGEQLVWRGRALDAHPVLPAGLR